MTCIVRSFAPLALALAVSAPAWAAPAPYEAVPDGVVVTPTGGQAHRVRLQVISDRIIRVTASPTDGFDQPASLMSVAQPRPDGYQVKAGEGEVDVSTGQITARVSLADGAVRFLDHAGKLILAENGGPSFAPTLDGEKRFWSIRQRFLSPPDEAFYGLGQHQKGQVDLKGQDVELAQHNMDIGVPFVLSSRGYGILWDNNSITRFGDPRPYQTTSHGLKIVGLDGKPNGFTARYYVGDKLRVERWEPDINYQFIRDLPNWPAELKGLKDQKVVWEGDVSSDIPGLHRFQLYVSSYVRMWVDGKPVIDAWRQNWNPWFRNVDVVMTPGQPHHIKIEWVPNDGYIALLHQDPLPPAEQADLSLWSELAKGVDYYFVAGRDADEVVSGYRQVTGKAVMLPRWAYGFWQSRQRYETQGQLLDVLHTYRSKGLPLDNIVQDWRYWADPDWGTHDFDKSRFPDPKAMVDAVHAASAHIMISVWPKFYPHTDNYKALDAIGGVYRRNVELGHRDWVGSGFLSTYYDPYSAQVRDLYWKQIKEKIDVLGFDAYWLDNDEPDIHSNLSIEERKEISGPTALGSGAEYFNTFPLEHVRGVYEHWRQDHPDTRVFLFTRSGYAGLQRFAGSLWSGDVPARWEDMRDQVAAGVNLSMAGIPNWSFDIGGYAVEDRYAKPDAANLEEWRELQLRWFQFGAFVPLFRAHGEFPYREIWNVSPEGTPVYDSLVWYDRLRYRLMPYIYTVAADLYHRDATMMRGLVMDFPTDAKAREVADQYMFGPAFLVSPVSAFKARERSVYLPAGQGGWYDFYSGKAFKGGQTIKAAAPLERMPLFVRAGSIVPVGPEIQHTGEKPDAPLTLFVYAGRDGAFDLYEDDGVSYGYERGAFSRIPIRWDQKTGVLSIGERTGDFPGMVRSRTFKVKWISGPDPKANDFDGMGAASVLYDGRAVTLKRGR